MRVAVLGCGPAGLIAAHAAIELGHNVTIISQKKRSQMFGAMYLHQPIPGIDAGESMEIQVVKLGSREGYAENVYGDPDAPVSWDKFNDGPTQGWDLGATYSKLWDLYSELIEDMGLYTVRIKRLASKYDVVFSTIPATVLCENWDHKFASLRIWVMHGPEKRKGNVMYYNGLPANRLTISWYRYSLIRGYQSWEYSPYTVPREVMRLHEAQWVGKDLRIDEGTKPLFTNCDCLPTVYRLGRFGKWSKHAFTHHAYGEVRDALYGM